MKLKLAGNWVVRLIAVVVVAVCGMTAAFGQSDPSAAKELFRLINQSRSEAGREPLQWDDRLEQAALQHTELMARRAAITHQFSGEPVLRLRLAQTSIRLDRSGENVALDTSVVGAHDALMHSPGHRANILSPDFNAVGIGVVWKGKYLYVTEDFAHSYPELSIDQVESDIADAFDTARRAAGAKAIRRAVSPELRKDACSMATTDTVQAANQFVPRARFIVAFTTNDPSKLPSDVLSLRGSKEFSSYAVGACFRRSPTYPSGVYWAVMAFYPKLRME